MILVSTFANCGEKCHGTTVQAAVARLCLQPRWGGLGFLPIGTSMAWAPDATAAATVHWRSSAHADVAAGHSYLLFDSLAGWLRQMFAAVLNVPPASLNWIFGETDPEALDVIPVERPQESASERVRVP